MARVRAEGWSDEGKRVLTVWEAAAVISITGFVLGVSWALAWWFNEDDDY